MLFRKAVLPIVSYSLLTDGFEPYEWAIKSILGLLCVYTQIIKRRCNSRLTKVDRRLILGTVNTVLSNSKVMKHHPSY